MEHKKNVVLITGSYPPDYCGVGDYSSKLFNNLEVLNQCNVELFYRSKWGIKYFFNYLKELTAKKASIFHLQYPTEGYGYSMVPLMLIICLRLYGKITIVTIHELSSRNKAAYIYTQLMLLFSSKVIVSNVLECKHANRFVFKRNKVFIIPIASNIKKSNLSETNFSNRDVDLAYFGHIRPIKGIEGFITAIELLGKNHKVQLIGQSLPKYNDFFETIARKAQSLKIEMIIDKEEHIVSDLLSNIKIVYLPFPDGVSNRRGTLLASIQNGCVVISKKSNIQEFNDFFEKYIYLVDTDDEAVVLIQKLLKYELLPKDTTHAKQLFTWDNVVSKHLEIYGK